MAANKYYFQNFLKAYFPNWDNFVLLSNSSVLGKEKKEIVESDHVNFSIISS